MFLNDENIEFAKRYNFLFENYNAIENGSFVLTEDTKEKLENGVNKYLEDTKKLIEDYRQSTNKLKFRQKINHYITTGFLFLFGLSIGGPSILLKTKEKIFSIVMWLVSYFCMVTRGKKLNQDYDDLKKIKSKLQKLKKDNNADERRKIAKELGAIRIKASNLGYNESYIGF